MIDRKVDVDAWLPATCQVLVGESQFDPIDLSMPDSSLDMPDVQLDALCDIIFADLEFATGIKR